ncbi:hypothetical protein CFP56_017866 [Quercus suber]|uniref:Uncharacterized protein n=1 Tax=Quercus suber TaxID=58331 RepID=A0AAW0KMJ0_QUESU
MTALYEKPLKENEEGEAMYDYDDDSASGSSGFGINKNKKDRKKFQYDPESYDLNFDGGFDCEEDDLVLGFSSRFAAPIHNHEERWRTSMPALIGQ